MIAINDGIYLNILIIYFFRLFICYASQLMPLFLS